MDAYNEHIEIAKRLWPDADKFDVAPGAPATHVRFAGADPTGFRLVALKAGEVIDFVSAETEDRLLIELQELEFLGGRQ